MAVADLCFYSNGLSNFFKSNHIDFIRSQLAMEQIFVLSQNNGIVRWADICHIDTLSGSQLQAAALADRIMFDTLMLSQHLAFCIHKISRRQHLICKSRNGPRIIPVRHKADILTVRLCCVDKTMFFGDLTDIFLPVFSQWKTYMCQLFLGQIVQHIRLILRRIQSLFQQIPATFIILFHTRIMPGHNKVPLQLVHPLKQFAKLQVTVTVDTWIGRTAVSVGFDKAVDNCAVKMLTEIKHIKRHIQLIRHCPGILRIVQRTAGLCPLNAQIFILIQLQHHTDTVRSRLLRQKSRHRTVHASTHRNNRLFHTISFYLYYMSICQIIFCIIFSAIIGDLKVIFNRRL